MTMPQEDLADYLTTEIRNQDPLHSELLRDLAKLASSPMVNEEDFHATFLKVVTHFSLEIQPLRLVFRWLVRGFAGHLLPDQLLYLWDIVLAHDSMTVFPLFAASILSFRKDNIMQVDTLSSVEAVLADLSSLPVVPLLQHALEQNKMN